VVAIETNFDFAQKLLLTIVEISDHADAISRHQTAIIDLLGELSKMAGTNLKVNGTELVALMEEMRNKKNG